MFGNVLQGWSSDKAYFQFVRTVLFDLFLLVALFFVFVKDS
jgi:hypothetical protein